MTSSGFLNIAHRGASFKAPENTLAAFHQARLDGASWIEFDLRMTRDRHLVVFHDGRLKRTALAAGQVGRLNLSQLKTLDVGSWFHPDFHQERVPTLAEVWEQCPDLGLNIEIKARGMEAPLLDFLRQVSCENIIVSCFLRLPLKRLMRQLPELKTGILIQRRLGLIRKLRLARQNGFYSAHIEQSLVDPIIMAECLNLGLKLIPWSSTIMHEGRLRQLLSLPIHGLINDMPDRVRELQKIKQPISSVGLTTSF